MTIYFFSVLPMLYLRLLHLLHDKTVKVFFRRTVYPQAKMNEIMINGIFSDVIHETTQHLSVDQLELPYHEVIVWCTTYCSVSLCITHINTYIITHITYITYTVIGGT